MQGGFPVGTSGSDWSYDDITKTLTLTSGTYDFSNTNPKTKTGKPTNQAVRCKIEIQSRAEITGGIFTGGSAGEVKNYGTISGGTFQNTCSVTNDGTIMGNGTFEGKVTSNGTIMGNGIFEGIVTNNSLISGGTFQNGCSVTNNNTISGGTFKNTCSVTNNSFINDGTFEGTVTNDTSGRIFGGTFQSTGSVTNKGNIDSNKGTFEGTVTNNGNINKGTFNGEVLNFETIANGTFWKKVTNNQGGNITNGTFEQEVINNDGGEISGGIFKRTVLNGNGIITGGTFAAGLSRNDGSVTGGVFNGYIDVDVPRVGVYPITVHEASPDAKIEKVNGVSAVWDPYVVVMEGNALPEVTVTASTEIFSLNDQPLSTNPYNSRQDSTDKNTVTFTMQEGSVIIGCGGLIMTYNGYPIGTSGNGWSYDNNTKTLTLTDGTFDFNFTYPQNPNKGPGAEPVACAVVTQSGAEITGGTFAGEVTNNDTINNGTFAANKEVKNYGTINNGTFNGEVTNHGNIKDGTFEGTVKNWTGTISGGTFKETVINSNGEITGGTFAGSVTNTYVIYGGVFNGNATLTNVTGLHSITVASGAKIKEVNGMSADWDPYVVVTENATTNEVIITADTEIFSLNGKPIGDGNCNSSYGSDKTIVTFTMPDDNVVLNEEINYGDFVMKDGYPEASNGGKTPCWGNGWEYDSSGILILKYGTYDFSSTHPQNISAGTQFAPAVQCAIYIQPSAEITGGTFSATVKNHIGGTIFSGTFDGTVENKGTITGGIFAAGLSKNSGNVTGGVFNGNTALTDARHVTVTDGSLLKVNGEDPRNVDETTGAVTTGTAWDLYSYAGTTVTITADTEIFSLNGQPIAESSYGSDKTTVTFTMPDDDVVLNGELITKPEPEPEPEPTPEPKPEPKPEPEPTTYTVTVIGGTIDGKTSVSAKENDTLTVVLDQNDIPDGMTFDLWSISSSKLSGDINVDYRAEAMTFKMPAEDVTIRAQYRSAEIIEDAAPSPLATAATIAVGGAAAGIVVWQGVSLGVDLYLANALPQGVPVPTDRRALALLLWETAGKPEVALPTLYGDIPTEEIELQKATRWAVQNGLMDAADKKDASFFDPDHYVTKMDVFGAWLRLKKLLGTT